METKVTITAISKIKANPNNPRVIKDDKFKKLVKSIQEFPKMMELRPIVVNDDMVVLGGNMRLKACKELGLKEVPVIKASDLTEDQQRQFIIKDNIGFGEWDWDLLANEWDAQELDEWGVEVPLLDSNVNLDEFFNQEQETKENKFSFVLKYSEDDYNAMMEAFSKHTGTKEQIVFKLLIA